MKHKLNQISSLPRAHGGGQDPAPFLVPLEAGKSLSWQSELTSSGTLNK